jgi:PEP-CTERM motif
MKTLLLSIALAVIGFATAARAGSITFGDFTISQLTSAQIAAQGPSAFNAAPVGAANFVTSVCSPGPTNCVETIFTGGTVANAMSPGISVPPYAYTGNYYYGGIAPGATGTFAVPVTAFDIYWGWIGAGINPFSSYDDVLTVYTGDLGPVTITGSDLVAIGTTLLPPVLGYGGLQPPVTPGGPPSNADNDNQWFNISDPNGIGRFTASSSIGDPFEFVMSGVPEPSTWALMLLGFAGLGFAGYRRARAAGPRSPPSPAKQRRHEWC